MKIAWSLLVEAIVFATISAIIFGIGFFIQGLPEFNIELVVLGAGVGAYVGFAALPYINKKQVHRPATCAGIAAAATLVACLLSDTDGFLTFCLVIGAGVVGALAPLWARYA